MSLGWIRVQLRRWLQILVAADLQRTSPWRAGQDPSQARSDLAAATAAVRRSAARRCRPALGAIGSQAAPGGVWWQPCRGDAARWIERLACLVLLLSVAVPVQAASVAVSAPPSEAFRCDGVPLTATLHGGAVDDPTIPNRSAGTLPGAFVQLQWQQAGEAIALQLPRTNNAGAASFTDGRWWWSLEDPDHPRFRLRRGGGTIDDFACERA